ncbi:MAG: hypothetical protein J1F65_02760 [Clostridiales bacterium]|nr:hypothetical protein [Clostridiales bacterium]
MKQIQPTTELLQRFKNNADTLIFEGYCALCKDVTIYNQGDDYALIANVNGAHKCCFKTDSEDFVLSVLGKLKGKVELCGVDPFVTACLKRRYGFIWETNCYLYVWNGEPLPYKCKQDVRPMSVEFAQLISDGTHYHAPIDEIAECLARHPSAAVYLDGKPICWCLLHLEKSLGMLYTLPEHRHKGYALEVMTALTNKVIERGDVPYAFIVKENIASQNLAAKYNLVRVKQADYFEIDLDAPPLITI